MSPNHPAVRADHYRRPRVLGRWRCLLCSSHGIGGVFGWHTHYVQRHHETGETP